MGERRVRFKHNLRCEIVASEGVFLLAEKSHFWLKGELYIRLAPLLDGRYTPTEIAALLQEHASLAEAYYGLERLRRRDLIADVPDALSVPPERMAFFDHWEVAPQRVHERLEAASVAVVALGDLDPAPVQALLASMGVRADAGAGRWLVITDDYMRADLRRLNAQALARGCPWMLARPVGIEPWVGPLFIPGRTGCWACLAQRLRGHRKVESYLAERNQGQDLFPTAIAALPSTLETAYGIIATQFLRWIVCGENPLLEGSVISLDTMTLERRSHRLVRRVECDVCGDPGTFTSRQWNPVRIHGTERAAATCGDYRTQAPAETLGPLEHHISPITGIISSLQPVSIVDDAEDPTATYTADHNFALIDEELYFTRENLRGRASGKGKTPLQAKVGAICESIERYSGVFQGNEARITRPFADLADAIHPDDCQLFSRRQLEDRQRWNARRSQHSWVAEPFDESRSIEWSPVWSLSRDTVRYVPTAYCYYGYSRRHDAWFARADANGCSAGSSMAEAILQGFMELVERDSVALWWYNRLEKPAVDVASFDDPYLDRVSSFFHSLKLDFWVLDLTSDLNIPACAAIVRRKDGPHEDISFGFGAHFDCRIALLRCVTELSQLLPHVFRKEQYRVFHDADALAWWDGATLKSETYLRPGESLVARVQSDFPPPRSDDIHTAVTTCVELAADRGLEVLVLDQTRADTGLHAVKVIVPGLRHFWPRFAPGRLYTVPVEMGWLAEPLPEEALNPRLMFL